MYVALKGVLLVAWVMAGDVPSVPNPIASFGDMPACRAAQKIIESKDLGKGNRFYTECIDQQVLSIISVPDPKQKKKKAPAPDATDGGDTQQ